MITYVFQKYPENFTFQQFIILRSSLLFFKKRCFQKFRKNSQENTCVRVSFLMKLQASANNLKKRLRHRCFPVNFATFLRTPFFTEHFWVTAFEFCSNLLVKVVIFLKSSLLFNSFLFINKTLWFNNLKTRTAMYAKTSVLVICVEVIRSHPPCVKSVQIRSYFWSVFSSIRTRNNSVFGHFSRSATYPSLLKQQTFSAKCGGIVAFLFPFPFFGLEKIQL